MSVLQSPDWFAIITDLIYAQVPMKEISRRLDCQMSESLIRHYRAGGQPNFVRGEALLNLWEKTLNRDPNTVPRLPWAPGHHVSHGEMILRARCDKCGQILRGSVLERWEQLGLHYEKFGRVSDETEVA